MKKILVLVLATCLAWNVQAQKVSFYNAKNTYSLANLVAAVATVDTITNAGAGALYTKVSNGDGRVTIQVNTQWVSGTVAGTVTLYGSLDGITYTIIPTKETQTALATATLASQTSAGTKSYVWRLTDSPFLYYQVGVAGGTTVVYYMTAWLLKHGIGN